MRMTEQLQGQWCDVSTDIIKKLQAQRYKNSSKQEIGSSCAYQSMAKKMDIMCVRDPGYPDWVSPPERTFFNPGTCSSRARK